MALSRRNACIVYGLLLFFTIGIAAGTFGIGNIIMSASLTFYFGVAIIYYLIYIPKCGKQTVIIKEATADTKSQLSVPINDHPDNNKTDTKQQPAKPGKKRTRLYYLDNLKAFLTMIVVLHHCTGSIQGNGWIYMVGDYYNPFLVLGASIMGLNQSYFMPLFFFISGYFTPGSYDKKGATLFISDKFKRLGIPFVVYVLIIGPGLDLLIKKVLIGGQSYSYFPDAGPCWFLAWLLIFNSCYIMMDKTVPNYVMKFPSLLRLIIFGAILGVIQLGAFIVVPTGFLFMPITMGSLPFDVIFFSAGVIAKRNNWLQTISEMKACQLIYQFM